MQVLERKNYFSAVKTYSMNAIIVPTDFSPVAYNAARYAIALATDLQVTKVVLYNAYQVFISEDPEFSMPVEADIEQFKEISENGLAKMKEELGTQLPGSLTIEARSEYNMANMGIIDVCKNNDADLIVMGISGAESKLEEAIIGSTAVDVSKNSEKPVIIIPAGAEYSGLKKLVLAIDFKKVKQTTPVAEIKKILDATQAKFDVLHVETSSGDMQSTHMDEKNIFDFLFREYAPEYHFIKSETFTDGINHFAIENNSDLIIVIPKKHGLFDNIFKPSRTKALAFHSHIPIMTIHE